jgi:predicted transposase/invertase (TIGR01784 family)
MISPHDKFFKEMFSKKDVAESFLKHYLPEKLLSLVDTESLEISKNSFVDSNLKEYFSDIIYKININNNPSYIYCLFEHKSYPDKNAAFQLLKYMTKTWELHLKQNMSIQLPVILPLLIYHGDKRYNVDKNFSAIVNLQPNTKKYVPNFEFLIYDFSDLSKQHIWGNIQLQITLKIMNSVFSKNHFEDKLSEILRLFKKLDESKSALEYFTIGLKYIFEIKDYDLDIYNLEIIKQKINKIIPERNDAFMTIADKLREEGKFAGMKEGMKEGIKEGIKEGMLKGIEEGKRKVLVETITQLMIQKLAVDKLPDQLENKLEKANIVDLKAIRDNILKIDSIKELKKYLD